MTLALKAVAFTPVEVDAITMDTSCDPIWWEAGDCLLFLLLADGPGLS